MTTAPKTEEKTAHTPGPLTTIKFTTTVEFTPEQWTEYKEAKLKELKMEGAV